MNRRQFNLGFLGAASAIPFRSLRTIVTVPGAVATGSCQDDSSFYEPVATAPGSVTELRVNGPRLIEHINALAEFGKNPQGGVSRLAYSEADRQGRQYVVDLMRAAKLDVNIDAAGNIIGRRGGGDKALKPILFGSHIDSVPE